MEPSRREGLLPCNILLPFIEEGLRCFRRIFGFTIIECHVLFEVVAIAMVQFFVIVVHKFADLMAARVFPATFPAKIECEPNQRFRRYTQPYNI